jgi:hypothetical protein
MSERHLANSSSQIVRLKEPEVSGCFQKVPDVPEVLEVSGRQGVTQMVGQRRRKSHSTLRMNQAHTTQYNE